MKTRKDFRIFTSDGHWWHVQDLTNGKVRYNFEAIKDTHEWHAHAKSECECWLLSNLIYL